MTQSPSASPCSTSHSTVPWAKSLISRSTATPQPSIIIPVWPVGTNTADWPAAMRRRAQLERDRHLADRAVGRRPSGSPACPGRGAGRPRSPSAPAVAGSRRSWCRGRRPPPRTPGRRRGTCAGRRGRRGRRRSPPRIVVPPRGRQLAAGRGDADQERVGRRRRAPGPRRGVATIGMSWPGRNSSTFRPACVESRTATTSSRP